MRIFLAVLFALLFAPAVFAQTGAPPLTPAQEQAVERIVRDYLVNHPEIVVEALEALRQRERDERQANARGQIPARRDDLSRDPATPSIGNPQGDVALVEFFDYRCPYCKQVHAPLQQLLKEDGKLRLVLKELPILGPDSVVAARAALAAHKQGRYFAMHDVLMRARPPYEEAAVLRLAAPLGLDIDRLKADMAGEEIAAALERNRLLAQAIGVNGTPGFVIGDRLIPGAVDLDTLRKLIAEERARRR